MTAGGLGTVSRRAMLAATAALPVLLALAGGCVAVRPGPPAAVAFADMHIHLFNAHDLPVGKFLVEVLFREQRLPRLLKAVPRFQPHVPPPTG